MCPRSTTIANMIEKPIKIVLSVLYCQNIRARRKGSPVCPEKNKSFPVKIPLKASLFKKNGRFIIV